MKRSELVKKLKEWLKEDGILYFRKIQKKYGRIDAIWMDGKIPHPVHFREGMQVRNFLRKYVDWDPIKLDDEWVGLVEKAISQNEVRNNKK